MGVIAAGLGLVVLAVAARSSSAQAPAGQPKPAAVVNGEPIPIETLVGILEQQVPSSPRMMTDAEKREIQRQALDMLIDDVLLRQFLRQNTAAPQPAEVNAEIGQLTEALKKQNQTLQEFLRMQKQSEAELRNDVSYRLRLKAYLIGKLPDAAVKAYYDENKLFFDRVFVRAQHVLLRVPNPPGAPASAAEKQATRARLVEIRQQILEGKITFEQAAKTYSQCPSNVNGGDIGFFPYKFVIQEPIVRAAFAMKINEVSDIIETEMGYHIIKVTERKEGQPSRFEDVKDMARDLKAQEDGVVDNLLRQLRQGARIEVLVP
jgi:parvulin-like peptidyl-prolyl isomerase